MENHDYPVGCKTFLLRDLCETAADSTSLWLVDMPESVFGSHLANVFLLYIKKKKKKTRSPERLGDLPEVTQQTSRRT